MKQTRTVGLLALVAGILMVVAGAVTYGTVSSQLSAENITVPDDAAFLAGASVNGPFSAYAQADIINTHALGATEGKTYAELGDLAGEAEAAGDEELAEQYNQQRGTVMNASFLRASLFTSVLAFGVSALVIGLGVLFALIGWALMGLRPAVRAETVRDETVVV